MSHDYLYIVFLKIKHVFNATESINSIQLDLHNTPINILISDAVINAQINYAKWTSTLPILFLGSR